MESELSVGNCREKENTSGADATAVDCYKKCWNETILWAARRGKLFGGSALFGVSKLKLSKEKIYWGMFFH